MTTEYTMFIWASKKLGRVDCSIVQASPIAKDVSRSKYTRILKSDDMRISVLGTGDVLAIETLVALAKSFKAGNWKRYHIRKGEHYAD